MSTVKVRYGRGEYPVKVPQGVPCQVIRKETTPLIFDSQKAVLECFDHPIGSPCLSELARNAGNACIAICDVTRPVPNHLFLGPMIKTLYACGIPLDQITIIVATGLHRPNLGEELDSLIGDPWVRQNVQAVNHNANAVDQHVRLGRTKTRGTSVRVDRRFVEADLRIVTGLVEPHFMAGYSGGRKIIAPGLAHSETIRTFHNAKFMADPGARNCNFLNNPLHEEQLEIVGMLGDVYAVNTVIDEDRRLSRINFGEVISSHLSMVEEVRADCEIPVTRRFQTVLTSSAGYPLDQTYYQAIKGMVSALEILEPGGNLIVAAACNEGFGSEAFRASQQRLLDLGPERLLQELLEKPLADIDEWQTQKQLEAMARAKIHLFTEGLSEAELALTGVECSRNLQALIHRSLSKSRCSSLAIIPEGPYVVPRYQKPHSNG